MKRNLLKLLKRSVLMLCFVLLASCSDGGKEYILTAELTGGGMTAAIPAEGGYIDIDLISNVPFYIMEFSFNGNLWLRWSMEEISSETIYVAGDMSTLRLTLDANPGSNNRMIYIRFANKKGTLISGAISLTQDALLKY